MKYILLTLLILGLIATPIGAQELEYPWNPYETLYNHSTWQITSLGGRSFRTMPEAEEYRRSVAIIYIELQLYAQINDTIHLGILNGLSHTTNARTLALANSRIPIASKTDNTLRFLISLMYEKEVGFSNFLSLIPITHSRSVPTYYVASLVDVFGTLTKELSKWNNRAAKVVDTMEYLEGYLMNDLASKPDFVRDSALVSLGEKNGFKFTAGAQNLYITPKVGDTRSIISPLRSITCREAHLIEIGTAATATGSITPKGPVLIKVGTTAATVQNNGIVRVLTREEIKQGIKVTPIDPPTVIQHIGLQTVEAGTTQTVTWTGFFGGLELTYTATSSNTAVATVSLSSDTGILDITAKTAGQTTIKLTASNPAGNAVTSFLTTVTARTE